jgi:hypothetical protein
MLLIATAFDCNLGEALKTNFRIVAICCFMLCIIGPLYGQNSSTGDIRGTVTDPSGAVVPGAKVAVVNSETGVTKEFTSNNSGIFDTVSTPTGTYTVTFTANGFEKLVRGPITLNVGIITLDGRLTLGSAQEQVVVTGDTAALIQTESSEQSTILDAKTILQLPQAGPNGADWQNFTILLPGASGTPSSGVGVAVNGNLPYYSNFLADGSSVTLPQSSNLDTSTFETLAEVDIDASTFSAQYGIGGAVFNQITKGGTNTLHGSAYEFFQNNALNARSYFDDPTTPLPKLRFNQFGGSIGGPIIKKKMFYYFNYDQTIDNGSWDGFVTVPTMAERQGNFADVLSGPALDGNGNQQINPCDGSVILQNQIFDQSTLTTVNGQPCRTAFKNNQISHIDAIANALQTLYPKPNRDGLANNYFFVSPAPNPSTRIFGRSDYDVDAQNRVTLAITRRTNHANYVNEFPCPINCQNDTVNDTAIQLSDVWSVSSTFVNEFRFGFNRQGNWFVPDSVGKNYPQDIGLQYAKANILPDISISGGVGSCCDGLYANANYIEVGNSFEPSDVVTLIRGRHIIHVGGELLAYQNNSTPWGNMQAGEFSFGGVYTQATPTSVKNGFGYADFLLGEVEGWSANNQPESGARQKSPQLFIQDDIKIRPNFTLNLGLRYQIQGGWSESKNYEGTFDPTIMNSVSGTLGAMWFAGANHRNQLQKNVNDVILPRVGFAWTPKPNTVLRGGFGIYSYNWSADNYGSGVGFGSNHYGSAWDQTNGVTPLVNLSGSGSNLPYLSASTSPTAYNGQGVSYNPYHTPVAKIMQWSLGIQRELGHGMHAEIAYVASHGENLSFPRDINQIPESELGANDNPSGRPYPQFEGISGNTYNGHSNYNSLQAQAQKRISAGWSFNVNYTFSHFLNNQDSAGWGGKAGPQPYQNGYDLNANYGASNFDIRHMLKGSAVYDLPFGKGKAFLNRDVLADEIIGGWRISSTLVAQTGTPFTVTYGGTNESYSQAGSWWPNLVGDPHVHNPGISGWFNPAAYAVATPGTFGDNGRNTLRGPKLVVVNLSLGKTFRFSERANLQVRADAQNALNHPSFGAPDTNFDDPVDITSNPGRPSGAGTIGSTTVSGRNMQVSARFSF